MTRSQETLEVLEQLSAVPSKLTGNQLTRAMHAARKIQMTSEQDSAEWKAAAKLIDIFTTENARRLFPDQPPPKSGAHIPGRRGRKVIK